MRWRSDIYEIYCRLSKQRLLDLSEKMSRTKTTQFINGSEGFFDTLLDVEPVEAADSSSGAEAGGTGQSEASEESDDERESDGAGSESMSDDEFERRCGSKLPAPAATHDRDIEALFEDDN